MVSEVVSQREPLKVDVQLGISKGSDGGCTHGFRENI
jgi:hypothetical protein